MMLPLLFIYGLNRTCFSAWTIVFIFSVSAFSQEENDKYYTSPDGTKIYVLPHKAAVYKKESNDADISLGNGLVKTQHNELIDHIFYRFKHYDNRNINSDKPIIFKLLISDKGKLERMKMIKEIDSLTTETIYNILRTSGGWFPAEHNSEQVFSELFLKLTIPSRNAAFYIEMEQLLPSGLDLKKDTLSGTVKSFYGSNEIISNPGLYEKYRRLFGIELARATLPWYLNELKKHKPDMQFYVQTVLRNNTDAEFVWLTNIEMISDSLIKGELDADPEVLPNKKGDIFEISVNEITDWMIIKDNEITGGWGNEEFTRKTMVKAPWELSKFVSDNVQYELAKKAYLNSITLSRDIEKSADYPGGIDKLKKFLIDNEIARFDVEFSTSHEAQLKNKRFGQTMETKPGKFDYAFLIMPDGKILNPVILRIGKTNFINILKYAEPVIPAKKFSSNVLSAVIINL